MADPASKREAQILEEERKLMKQREKLENKKRRATIFDIHLSKNLTSMQKNQQHHETTTTGATSSGQQKQEQAPVKGEQAGKAKTRSDEKKDTTQQKKPTSTKPEPKPVKPAKPILRKPSLSATSARDDQQKSATADNFQPPPPNSPDEIGPKRSQAAVKGEQLLTKKIEEAKSVSIKAAPKKSFAQRFTTLFQRSSGTDDRTSGEGEVVRNKAARNALLGIPLPPITAEGDSWQGGPLPQFSGGPTPKVSGYISVQDFANNIIDDPQEVETWVKSMATKYYLFWVFLVLCASFMNAVLIFVFHFMANVYARDILHEILLWNAWNVYGVVGTMLSFIAIAFWGVWMLTTPRLRSKFLVRFRWFLVMLVLAYVAFCIINQVALCSRDLKGALERKMIHDLKKTKNKTTRLEDYSHQYFQCCGIRSYRDWQKFGHTKRSNRIDLRGGYPPTCCKKEYHACSHNKPVTIYLNDEDDKDIVQIWEYSCLEAEYNMVVGVMTVLGFIQIICWIGTLMACFLLKHVIMQTNYYNVDLCHPFV